MHSIATPLGPGDPRRIGQFTIIGLLGVGGMGEVYLGTDGQGYVAVKRIRSRLVSGERFKREVGILCRVPLGIAPGVLAHDSTAPQPWFATDYVPGVTADEAFRLRGPLPAGSLWLLLGETAAHLRAVHDAGIVHRDLKPANVMLVHDGVRLIDFGIARAVDQTRLTRQGEGYGTLGFTAPELRAGDSDATAAADVYSLGALLLYLASGSDPSRGLMGGPARCEDSALAAVITACLAADPGDRPTAAELAASAQEHVPASDPSWPAEVMEQIASRREMAATPVRKLETLPPPDLGPGGGTPAGSARSESWLDPVADKLARDVRKQWQQEERLRQVHDPYPLPVRFTAAGEGLSDHWANIRRAGRGTDPGPLPLDGDLDTITAVYRSIPSGRLTVLGEAGSGKTILALRFALDWLEGYAPGDRVPVVFSLGSWDPSVSSLAAWMRRQLARDHNMLEESAPDGGNLAGALIDGHRILPVLDGFDEIAPGLQGAALEALNYYAEPALLTSRPAEYGKAVRDKDVLTAAACVELHALGLDDVDDYLTRASRPAPDPGLRTAWEPVLSELRKRDRTWGAENIAAAFGNPLMISLARAVYSDNPGRDPRELLDTARFGTAEAVREHLLSQFAPAVYQQRPAAALAAGPRRPRNWSVGRAQDWLGYLAWHAEQRHRHDLAWWELGTVMRLLPLMTVIGAVVGLATGTVAGLVYGSASALAAGVGEGLRTGIVTGVMNGLGVGLTFGLMHGAATKLKLAGPVFEPSHMRIQLRGATARRLRENFLPRVRFGVIGGLLFGIVWAAGSALYSAVFSGNFGPAPLNHLALGTSMLDEMLLGTGLGIAIGFVAGAGAALEAVSEKENAADTAILLKKSRANALIQLPVVGLLIGAGYGAVVGPVHGMAAGLMTPIGLVTLRSWGRWLVLARVWLPLTGKTPWSLITFLDDAHHRGILRQAGAVYQFRHAQVERQLARQFSRRRLGAASRA